MNTSGTKLAVVGAEQSTAETRAQAVRTVLAKHNSKANEVTGAERDAMLKEFLSGKGWHHGLQVDRLSENEAEIIAERLVNRVRAKVTLSDEKVGALGNALSQAFRRRFISDPDKVEWQSLEQWRESLLKAAREHLDERGIEALREALAKGSRPQAGEK